MKTIPFAGGLELPLDVVTQKLAFLARSGAGKSYAAGVLVEGLLAAGAQVVIVDPVGTWYALRLDKDGKSKGFDIPVLGGEHGDVPLEATAGALVASLVAEKGLSMVLDVSDFNGAEQRRFVKEFAVALHRLKKANRSPVMIVWEECQDFIPQRVMGESAPMVGAMERLIKQGRNFGVGTTLITQRPQAANKDCLNQTEVLVVLQTTGPQERKAIEGWIEAHGLDDGPLFTGGRSLTSDLPKLPIGTAFVWSPSWLKTFRRVEIGRKRTFDASSTPSVGAKVAVPRKLEPVDMDELRASMAATIERAKAEDPKALQARVRELERELAAAKRAAPAVERVEVPVLEHKVAATLAETARELVLIGERVCGQARDLGTALQRIGANANLDMRTAHLAAPLGRARCLPLPASNGHAPAPRRAAPSGDPADARRLGRCERALLGVLAQREVTTSAQLAVMSGYSSTSSGFANALGALRTAGLVVGTRDDLHITPQGREFAGDTPPLPTGHALAAHWQSKLGRCERALLDALVSARRPLSKADLAEASGYSVTSSGFANALGKLRTLELAEGYEEVRAAAVLTVA